jgi:dTDP-4-dehydrorhamnose reductase
LNDYSRSKYYGELFIRQYPKHYIFRTYWLFGGGPGIDKKMCNIFYNLIKKGQKEVFAPDDEYGNPTYTCDVADAIKDAVIERKIPYGIYNCVNPEGASRYEFAKTFVKYINPDVKCSPASPGQFKKDYFANRPDYAVLNTNKLNYAGIYLPDWKKSLKEYTEKCYPPLI